MGMEFTQFDVKPHLASLGKLKEQLIAIEPSKEGITEALASYTRSLSPISADGVASVFAFSEEEKVAPLSIKVIGESRGKHNNVIF